MKHTLNIADAITASRILFAGFVLLSSAFSVQFYAFYLLGAFTDMIDGWVARKLNLNSSFGAKLDTVANSVFVIAVPAKVLLSVHIPGSLWIWIAVIAFIIHGGQHRMKQHRQLRRRGETCDIHGMGGTK